MIYHYQFTGYYVENENNFAEFFIAFFGSALNFEYFGTTISLVA